MTTASTTSVGLGAELSRAVPAPVPATAGHLMTLRGPGTSGERGVSEGSLGLSETRMLLGRQPKGSVGLPPTPRWEPFDPEHPKSLRDRLIREPSRYAVYHTFRDVDGAEWNIRHPELDFTEAPPPT